MFIRTLVVAIVALLVGCNSGPSEAEVKQTVDTWLAELSQTATAKSPTNTPAPTKTPRPTRNPTKRPTATKAPTATPTLAPIVLSGSGDAVVDVDKWDGASLIHIIYTGGSNFVVWNYGPNGEEIDLLVNTIGRYEGTLPLDWFDDEDTSRFRIESSGPWEIQVLPLEQVRFVSIPGTFEGIGDDVILLSDTSKPDLLIVDASQADSNFVIRGWGNDYDLLVNEIAPYMGTVLIDGDLPIFSRSTGYRLGLAVKAEGNWSIEVTASVK